MAYLVSVLLGGVLAGANYWILTERLGVAPTAMPELFWVLVAAPVLLALVVAAATGGLWGGASTGDVAAATDAPDLPEHGAMRLLALLQEEGRLIDFLTESVVAYSDEQIGAATRDIHDGCAKALGKAIEFEPVLAGPEDTEVTIEAGFDPSAIRLTGNVSGEPPFTGVLRHAGWRVKEVHLPDRAGGDPVVVAPAEVEIA